MVSRPWLADLALLAIAFIWGSTFVLVQNAIAIYPPFTFLSVRFLLSAMILFLFNLSHPYFTWKTMKAGILLGCWLFMGYALQTWSLLYTTSGKAGFLTGVSIILVPLLSIWLLKKRPGRSAVIGIILAVFGLWLLAFRDFSSLNIGDLLAAGCAVGFAMQIIYTGKYASWAKALPLATIQIATVAILSSIFAFLWEPWQEKLHPSYLLEETVIIAFTITVFFATVLAYFGQTYFQKKMNPTRVALIFAMEPVFAAITDWWWLGTTMNIPTLGGCLFILSGMIITELSEHHLKKKVSKK